MRSLAGTRWLAHKQTVIDVAVRAAYLMLTLGRGRQTLGEEYTDVMPFRAGAGNRGREKGMPGRTVCSSVYFGSFTELGNRFSVGDTPIRVA